MKGETNRESVERGLLHFVRALIPDGENRNAVPRTHKLFSKIEANDGVAAAVGVDDEHPFLACHRCVCHDMERRGR